MRQTLTPSSYATPAEFDKAWHAARITNITSTDVAALFGLSPYATAFELWHMKKGSLTSEIEENERMTWGTRLQDAIAQGIANDEGWIADRMDQFIYDDELRIGASFDFSLELADLSHALLEIKNVDSLAFKRGWQETDFGLEAPAHIELQVQHQMEVDDIDLAYIGALVGGNTVRLLRRERDRAVGAAIRQRVREFWASIDADTPPDPIMPEDAEIVCALYQFSDGSVIEADGDTLALIQQYHRLGGEVRDLEKLRDVTKAQLLTRIGPAQKVLAGDYSLSATQVADTPPTTITSEMIGQTYGGRKGYRLFRSYRKETKQEKAA